MKSSNISYLPALDQIRGLAALWILYFHAHHLIGSILRTGGPFNKYKMWEYTDNPLLVPLIEGHTAVALFMVLSGFIFTWGAYGKSIQYTHFIANRLLRIYPLYVTLILVGLAANPKAFDLSGLISMLLPLADFQSLHVGPITAMSWAIGVEFQFYLIFPLLFLLSEKSPIKTISLWILAVFVIRCLVISLGGNARDISYWHLAGRIDQFLLGMLAAYWLKTSSFTPKTYFRLFLASIPTSLFMLTIYHGLGGWPSSGVWKTLWPTIEGGMWAMFVAGLVGAQLSGQSAIGKLFAWVGVRSFTIYLLHYAIIQIFCTHPYWLKHFTGDWRTDALLNTTVILVPIVLLISTITWHGIEKPFLGLRKQYLRSHQQ